MNRGTHHLAGAVAGLGAGTALGWDSGQALIGVCLSTLVAGGGASPDMDQHGWFRTLDKVLPDEWLGHGGPLQHRGITHWWCLPVLAVVWAGFVSGGVPWMVLALLAGWCSHLVGDAFFGAESPGRGPGIPVGPWWGHRGVGWHSGGRCERWVARPVLVLVLVMLLGLVGVPN